MGENFKEYGAISVTADSLIGPRQCSVALGVPATSTVDVRHQGALTKPGNPKALAGFVEAPQTLIVHTSHHQIVPTVLKHA